MTVPFSAEEFAVAVQGDADDYRLLRIGAWVSNGHWGIQLPELPDGFRAVTEVKDDVNPAFFSDTGKLPPVAITEFRRRPFVPGVPCGGCDEDGRCRCTCGDEHECAACGGAATRGSAGYIDYQCADGGPNVAVQPRYEPLWRGLDISIGRGKTEDETRFIGRRAGEIVFVLMPYKLDKVRAANYPEELT